MAKKVFVPLTIENVGSEGKFFTDNTLLKLIVSVLAGLFTGFLVLGQLSFFLPGLVSFILGLVAGLAVIYIMSRKWVLKEGELFTILEKQDEYEIVNVGEFSDIYDHINGVCLHDSGHVSMFVKVVRGTTLGMSETEKDSFYACFKKFEDQLLKENYIIKCFNVEVSPTDFAIFDQQKRNCMDMGMDALENNLDIKNTYIKVFMDGCIRDEDFVYVVVSSDQDIDYFRLRVKQIMRSLTNSHIKDVYVMDNVERKRFGENYYDVPYFELDSKSNEETDDIIIIKSEGQRL